MNRSTLLIATLACSGCLTLDSFVHNAVHCSNVSESTCNKDTVWDRVCTPCDESYDWNYAYPWMEPTLLEGETIRDMALETIVEARIPTNDGVGELDLYFIPSHGENPALANTTLVYNHGNYAGIEHYIPRIRMLHEAGYHLLIWDYRGYGKSDPSSAPEPVEFVADSHQIASLIDDYAPDPTKVVVYANSLGGIPAVEMALHREPCAMILEAPWTNLQQSAENYAQAALPSNFLSVGLYDNYQKIVDYQAPLFVMVGDEDNKFPVEDHQRLVDLAGGVAELWVLPGVKHGIANVGVPEAGLTEYFEQMQGFMERNAPTCLN
jgi:pimeloyl-ACP methyl ester carboxylesterase